MTDVRYVHIDQITIPDNRQRTSFSEEALKDLADSIRRLGLLQPPVVREADGAYVLVAGERRLRACRLAGLETIPVRLFASLDPVDAFEAELEENIRRVDLSWQDRVRAIATLHTLRQQQAKARGEKYFFVDTARELRPDAEKGVSDLVPVVHEALVLSKHLNDPDVAKADSTREAIRILRKKLEASHREALSKLFDPSKSPHRPILGDAYEEMGKLPDGIYECIITDPPYGIGADGFGTQATARHTYKDDEAVFAQFLEKFPAEAWRLLKAKAHMYIFCDIRRFWTLKEMVEAVGFDVWPVPLIWDKGNNGMLPRPDHGPRRVYEAILFANKGDRRVVQICPDVIRIPSLTNPTFGAEKPPELYIDLLSRSVVPGGRILDPFMGTGVVFPAANAMHVTADGIEIDRDRYNMAVTRVMEYPRQVRQ